MKTFEKVRFAWTFRTYQQAVLDKASAHLRDGHIHIVAAPGSGKTILGLELVRRLGKPALILAPSVTIRRQWGERFAECFMPKLARDEEYVSEDLHAPQLLTCVTYQALHAAVQKTVLKTQEDPESGETETTQDYTDFDLLETIRRSGIRTICLDEAHHLRREWQKALEQFLQTLGSSVQVIALTATPPYDSTPAEWDNYVRVCGEVDEEIFVPQLVAQKTLCPHQDYLYFNMPTEAEIEVLQTHRAHALSAAQEIVQSGLMQQAASCLAADEALLQKDPQGADALSAAAKSGATMRAMQEGLSFLLANRDAFPQTVVEGLSQILAKNGVLEKGKVCLLSTDKIDKMLLSSAGKIDSIRRIMASESATLGEELRALILTDYIRKEMIGVIGSQEPLTVMGAVPIFEAVRRSVGKNVPIALLAGTLVILPNDVLPAAEALASQKGIVCSASPLPNVPYSEVTFAGSNKNKVSVLTELFQKGVLRVMIGTAALLGEGWDAPCINALILASYVGSFMLTNQMRGRAIRTDKQKPDKAANIWHLVTLDVQDGADDLGADFAVMQRRFDGFLAPDYESPWIESGTDRLRLPDGRIDETQMQTVNAQMLERAQDRKGMVALWENALGDDTEPQVLDVCEIPETAFSATPARRQLVRWILCAAAAAILLAIPSAITRILSVFALIPMLVFFTKWNRLHKPEAYFRAAGQALLRTLRSLRLIDASENDVYAKAMPERRSLYVAVQNASQHDKMVFSRAMGTLFSAIGDPRYILLPTGSNYAKAVAVPAAIDRKKEDAQRFAKQMEPLFGKTECRYVRGQKERETLLRCRQQSALNRRGCKARYKKIVIHK